MTARTVAIAYVTTHADTAATPALTPTEVGVIVDGCARADAAGLPPTDEAWEPSYFTTRAVQRALELRATRAATIVDTGTDGTNISGSQLAAQLSGAAKVWARRAARGAS